MSVRLFKTLPAVVLAMMLAAPQGAMAAEAYPKHYLTLDYQHVFRDGNRASTDANGGGIGYGYGLNDVWGFEFGGFYNAYGKNQFRSADWDEYGIKLDTLFFYSRNPWFSPYWVLGVGGVRSKERVSNQSSTDPFMDIGLGVMHNFNVGGFDFGVRADMRWRWIDTDGIGRAGFNSEPVIRAGLVLPFGISGERAAPVRAAEPAAGNVHAPLTAAEESRARVLAPVHFDFNKSSLTPAAVKTLDEAADTIKDLAGDGSVKVKLNGHTDSVGSDQYNNGLSERRAAAVAGYLTDKGVDRSIMSLHGYGKASPDKDNATEEGRAYNRRVDIKVVPAE